jgi:hypothetical protein
MGLALERYQKVSLIPEAAEWITRPPFRNGRYSKDCDLSRLCVYWKKEKQICCAFSSSFLVIANNITDFSLKDFLFAKTIISSIFLHRLLT